MSVGMRTAEVYLILAEAKARLKDIPSCPNIESVAWKTNQGAEAVLPEPATERAMVQAVIDERRKELISDLVASGIWNDTIRKLITQRQSPVLSRWYLRMSRKDIYVEAGFTVVYHSIPVGCPWKKSEPDNEH